VPEYFLSCPHRTSRREFVIQLKTACNIDRLSLAIRHHQQGDPPWNSWSIDSSATSTACSTTSGWWSGCWMIS